MTGDPMTADQAHAVAQALGQQIQQEWQTTVKVLEAIPEDKKAYKPDPKGRSAWELAVHLCRSDVWFLDGVVKQDFTPHGEDAPADTVNGLVVWYKHEMPRALEHVLALDGPKLASVVDFFGTKMQNAQFLVWQAVHNARWLLFEFAEVKPPDAGLPVFSQLLPKFAV